METNKRILSLLLTTALLAAPLTACDTTDDEIDSTEETTEGTTEETTTEADTNSTFENESSTAPQDDTPTRNITLSELREKLGCYVTTTNKETIKKLMKKDADKIRVEHEGRSSNIFHITTFQNGTEYKTTISLSEGIRTPDIYYGFTNEQNGYVIIFHLEDYAISPMDDIELACLLKTTDGGKTWETTEYQDFRVTNSRQYITAAYFFTEEVGFFTARYHSTDHFELRTLWTVDGGKTWSRMPLLPKPNMMAPFGFKGDQAHFATEVVDAELIDGVYVLTVEICSGSSYAIDGNKYSQMYIQFSSTDLENWTLVK